MSHYYALVLIPGEGDVDELLSVALAPYDEQLEVEQRTDTFAGVTETYWTNPHGFYDWYQVGGRYTGRLSGYDPDTDDALRERCDLCDGGGLRNDAIGRSAREDDPSYTCNGCRGTGRRRLWPTQWPRHDGDVMPALFALKLLIDAPEDTAPYTFLAHGAEHVAHRERYEPDAPHGERFVEQYTPESMVELIRKTVTARHDAGHVNDRIVVVDYHN